MRHGGLLTMAVRALVAAGMVGALLIGPAARAQDPTVELTSRLVVMISGKLDGADTIGAGIIFARDNDGFHVLTANHVVRRANREVTQVRVMVKGLPNRWLDATLLPQADPSPQGLDLAVLRVPGLVQGNWTACSLALDRLAAADAKPESLVRGTPVFPIGYPGGEPWGMPVVADRVADVVGDEIKFQSAVMANGHSGGALVTGSGVLAGMLRLENAGFGFAVSIGAVINRLRGWGYAVELRPAGSIPPLNAAAKRGDATAVARVLRDRCVSVDGVYQGWSALQESAAQGDATSVRALLAAGANKSSRVDGPQLRENGMTPLALAASKGHADVVRVLLTAGTGTEDGGAAPTPLERAARAGHRDAALLLRDAGGSTAFLRERDGDGNYPLHTACRGGDLALARLLVELGADVNASNNYGGTALTCAANGRREMVELLLSAGANPSGTANAVLENGWRVVAPTPLAIALEYGPDETDNTKEALQQREIGLTIVERLIRSGADVKHVDVFRDGWGGNGRQTALGLAASNGRPTAVKRLLALGLDVNVKNGRGETALHAAAEMWHPFNGAVIQRAVLQALHDAGANVNALDDEGDPPLCDALLGRPLLGRKVVIEMLLDWGARPLMMEQCHRKHIGINWAPDEGIDRLLRARGATGK
jgi:ankyrin repeat protein